MTIYMNMERQFVAYLPSVKIVDPACAGYAHSKQETYIDCCKDIINGCDIEIARLQVLRETYEKRMLQNQIGVKWKTLEGETKWDI